MNRNVEQISVFDVIGPVMTGPSSSHTAGAVRIGNIAGLIYGKKPARIKIVLYGSFAGTYRGHGTDKALVAGILGMKLDDCQIKDALQVAAGRGIGVEITADTRQKDCHPNTAKIILEADCDCMEIVSESVGGGEVRVVGIDGFKVSFNHKYPSIICRYHDKTGIIACVTAVLARHKINIASMHVVRCNVKKQALMIIETDNRIPVEILQSEPTFKDFIKSVIINDAF